MANSTNRSIVTCGCAWVCAWGRARLRRVALACVVGVALIASAGMTSGARAADPEFLTYGGGIFDINGDDTSFALSLEFTDDRRWISVFQPMTGLMINSDGSIYGYAGLAADLFFGRRFVLTPSFAPGLYLKNGGKDLGHVIEFRSSLKFAYRLDDRARIGLDFHHMSNASLDDHNPGANTLMLTYSVPFKRKP